VPTTSCSADRAQSRPLTVLQLLPALESGGVERSTLEVAAALVAAGHRSHVVSAGGRLETSLLAGGSLHTRIAIGDKSLRTLARVRELRQLIAELRPDIVHARSRLPAWLLRLALRGMGPPRPHVLTTVHGLNSPGRYSAVLTRGERVICVSESVRNHLLAHYRGLDPRRLRVIPRGIDPQAFPHGFVAADAWREAFLAEHPALRGGVLLTLPGRGTRLKGHADAIALLEALRRQGVDARLLLLGAAERGREAYLSELHSMARARGVEQALVITPPRADVREVLSISALVLQLSRKPEAFGRTVLEALGLGRPVLGYAHGGVGELLAAHYPEGRVAVGDLPALVAAAARRLADPLPLPARPLPTMAAMQEATLALYREVADGDAG